MAAFPSIAWDLAPSPAVMRSFDWMNTWPSWSGRSYTIFVLPSITTLPSFNSRIKTKLHLRLNFWRFYSYKVLIYCAHEVQFLPRKASATLHLRCAPFHHKGISLVLYLVTSDGYRDTYTETVVGCTWEDDVYVITDQSNKDIALYTVENQTNETVETVHGNLLLPLSTVIDWRRPFDPLL